MVCLTKNKNLHFHDICTEYTPRPYEYHNTALWSRPGRPCMQCTWEEAEVLFKKDEFTSYRMHLVEKWPGFLADLNVLHKRHLAGWVKTKTCLCRASSQFIARSGNDFSGGREGSFVEASPNLLVSILIMLEQAKEESWRPWMIITHWVSDMCQMYLWLSLCLLWQPNESLKEYWGHHLHRCETHDDLFPHRAGHLCKQFPNAAFNEETENIASKKIIPEISYWFLTVFRRANGSLFRK